MVERLGRVAGCFFMLRYSFLIEKFVVGELLMLVVSSLFRVLFDLSVIVCLVDFVFYRNFFKSEVLYLVGRV